MVKPLLEAIERLEPSSAGRVFDEIDPIHVKAVREASLTAWVDARHQAAIDEGFVRALGRAAMVEHARQFTRSAGDNPVFAPLLKGTLAIFGLSPKAMYSTQTRAWKFSARGLGRLEHEPVGPKAHRIVYSEVPEFLRNDGFVGRAHGPNYAMMDLVRAVGTVDVDESELQDRGRLEFVARWD